MTQISRPFQIVLVAFALFVAVWFVALQGHSSSSSSTPVASTPAPAPASTPSANPAPGSTHIEGMTRAVAHAREAVAASQRASDKAANSSAEAPSQGASVTSSSTTVVTKHGTAHTSTTVVTKHAAAGASAPVVTKHVVTPAPHKVAAGGIPAQQAAVESELKQGKVVLVLFWNPKGADDVAVHNELPAVQHALGGKVAVHYASAGQVGDYGTITHAVQVTQTPTLLIVNPHGQTTVLTGLTDSFSIEQSVSEARA